jgi:hypothetical protein
MGTRVLISAGWHQFITMPRVGAFVALAYMAAIDDPDRFSSSKKWIIYSPQLAVEA